ncbi:ArsR/SmtB family transcription factor [Demequina activiva]|uniref:Transcriptional regulator n=1 Tax=Demequina activiva TaxID=1582364 RepID=A0A919Q493_9MICO|nr:winged helix-turn-helix domain-containing protein [Demequina activiva]GIG54018.1 transcriptional regulator [Demequina activiva]
MPASLPVIDATEPLCCAPLGSAQFAPDDDAEQIAARLRAMADANRVRILQQLSCCDGHEMTTTEVAGLLQVSAATASHHLHQLEKAGMVASRRDGARVQYGLRLDSVRAVAHALDVTCGARCC